MGYSYRYESQVLDSIFVPYRLPVTPAFFDPGQPSSRIPILPISMKHPLFTAAILLSISTSLLAQDTVTVSKVISSTRIQTTTGATYNLIGIGPPRSKAVTPEDCTLYLKNLIDGQQVVLIPDTIPVVTNIDGSDEQYVYLDDQLVNLRMIEDGYATALKIPTHSRLPEFVKAERTAKDQKVGAYAQERSTAVQCSGITKKGDRCQRMTTKLSGRCYQHE